MARHERRGHLAHFRIGLGARGVPLLNAQGQWLADLPLLARHRLARLGVREVRGAGLCTFQDAGRFYSYRRDGATGRMASLIWIEPHHA